MAGLSSISKVVGSSIDKKTAAFYLTTRPFPDDKPQSSITKMFQYFPESLSDSKAVNWTTKEIPGGSLPLYQWVSSGERILSFTAFFTSDVNLQYSEEQRLRNAGAFYRNVDVKSAILWLRQHLVPRYGGKSAIGTPLTYAPRTVVLTIPNSGIGYYGGMTSLTGPDEVLSKMTQCEVQIDKFWPNGNPRIASVQLSFAQIAQDDVLGGIEFPQNTSQMVKLADVGGEEKVNKNSDTDETTTKFWGYKLVPKARMRA